MDKKPRTAPINEKPASGKLLLASTKIAIRIEQDVGAKKYLFWRLANKKQIAAEAKKPIII